MSIKTKLSVRFTFLVFVILVFFSALVYYFSLTSQRTRFRDNLTRRARNTAVLLMNVKEIDTLLLKKIHRSTRSWENEEIVVIDSLSRIIYSNNVNYLTANVIASINTRSATQFFSLKEKDVVTYRHVQNNKSFHFIVAAYDLARFNRLSSLKRILFWSIVSSLILSVIFSYLFSRKAIKPISDINKQIRRINSARLGERLKEGRGRDEIEKLSVTFNEMLSNLESAFNSQQDFVSNASHELRTPLTVMITEADYILDKKRTSGEYEKYIDQFSKDLKHLNVLINSLLELAQLNRDSLPNLAEIRADDIIYTAIHLVKIKYPSRKIIPRIQYSENEDDLITLGNSGLLEIALKNVIDNACKFSNEDVIIETETSDNKIDIKISDSGIGVPAEDLENIFEPFKRASNVRYIGGFGIGLSLVARIIEVHKGSIRMSSTEKNGTQVFITLLKYLKID